MLYNIANLADYIVYRSLEQNKPLTGLQLYTISILLYLWNFKKFEFTHLHFGSKFLRSPDIEEHYPLGLSALGIFSVPFCYPFDWNIFKTPVLDRNNDFYSKFDEDIDFMIDAFYKYSKDYYRITELSEKIRVTLWYNSCEEDRYIPYDSIIESLDIIDETLNRYKELKNKYKNMNNDYPTSKISKEKEDTISLEDFAKKFKLEYHGEENSDPRYLQYHCFSTYCPINVDYKYGENGFNHVQKTAVMLIWIDENKEFSDRLSNKRVYIEFSSKPADFVSVNLNWINTIRSNVEEVKGKVRKKVKTFINAWNTMRKDANENSES